MFEAGSWLWRWLADQPPFMEVGIGMGFVLRFAPTVLAAVALICIRLERLAESIAAGRVTIRPSEWSNRQVQDEIAPATAAIPEGRP
jgi:hypothetical protein